MGLRELLQVMRASELQHGISPGNKNPAEGVARGLGCIYKLSLELLELFNAERITDAESLAPSTDGCEYTSLYKI